jgi:hypothetical protein
VAACGSGTIGAVTARAPGALWSAAAAALIVLAAVLGERVLLVVVVLLQGFSASNWRRGVPAGGTGQAAVLAWLVGAGAATAIAWRVGPDDQVLLPVVLALGVGFLGLIVVQLARRHPRPQVTSGMAAASLLLVVLVLGSVWLEVFARLGGGQAVVVGALPVGVAALARLLPVPWSVLGALLLGTLTGAALGAAVPVKGDPLGLAAGAAVGAVGGLVVALHAMLATRAQRERVSGPDQSVPSASQGTAHTAAARTTAHQQAVAGAWLRATAPFSVFVAAALVYPVLRVAVG